MVEQVQQQAGALRGLAASGHARKGSRDDLAGGRLSRRVQDPAAEAERKAAQEKMYSLDMDKVAKGAAPLITDFRQRLCFGLSSFLPWDAPCCVGVLFDDGNAWD